MDDFSALDETRHMLLWLADDPYAALRREVEAILRRQVSDSVVKSFRVVGKPQWLSGGRRADDDANRMILVRTGVAFAFDLVVATGGQSHELSGIFTWVGVNLDQVENRRQQIWFDLGGDLDEFGSGGELRSRIYLETVED